MAEFIPTLFRELGKPTDDLLSRKYKFEQNFKARTRTADGLTITAEQSHGEKGSVSKVTARAEDYKNFGAFEGVIDTSSAFKGTLKLTTLAKGLTIRAIGEQQPQGSVQVDYKQANVAVTATLSKKAATAAKKAANNLSLAGVVGFDGISLGAEFTAPVDNLSTVEKNFGFQFITASKDYEVSVKTADNTDKVSVYGLHKYTNDTSVATQIDLNIAEKDISTVITIGASQKFDSDTTIQGKFKTDKKVNTFSGVWERTLGPKTKLALATEFAYPAGDVKPKFGLSLLLGELNLAEL